MSGSSDASSRSGQSGLIDSTEERIAELLDAFLISQEQGRSATAQQLLADNSDIAIELQNHLDAIQALELDQPNRNESFSEPFTPYAFPKQLGRFEVGRILGQGAMGVVFAGVDTKTNRDVAIKVLTDRIGMDETRIERFRLEANTAAALNHPNVVPVYTVGCEQGVNYYTMRLIVGESLDRRIAADHILDCEERGATHTSNPECQLTLQKHAAPLRGPDRFRRIARYGISAASALHAAHAAGIIHRDVKPSNLLLADDGQLWVTDFGLARVQAVDGLTRTGELVGTLRYMSPEQARGAGDMIDARTDVFSLGATLYELVAGVPAFPQSDPAVLLDHIRNKHPKELRRVCPSVPADLETIIRKAMRSNAWERYPTAAALAEDLQRFVEGKSIRACNATPYERLTSWLQTHRKLACGLIALWWATLLLSFAITLVVTREHAKTKAALARSEWYYKQARAAVDTLGATVAEQLAGIPQAESIRERVLLDTVHYYEMFLFRCESDPELAEDAALSQLALARLSRQTSHYGTTDAKYERAIDMLESIVMDPNRSAQVRAQIGQHAVHARNEWAMLASEKGFQAAALARLSMPIKAHEFLASDPASATIAQAITHNSRGLVLLRQAKLQESLAEFLKVTELLAKLPSEHRSTVFTRTLSDTLNNTAALYAKHGMFMEAARAARQSLMLRPAIDRNSSLSDYCRHAIGLNNLAAFQWKAGQLTDAISAYEQSIRHLETAVEQAPLRGDLRARLSITLNNLALALTADDRLEAAEAAFRKAEALTQIDVQVDQTDPRALFRLGSIQKNLSRVLKRLGRTGEAEAWLHRGLETIRQLESTMEDRSVIEVGGRAAEFTGPRYSPVPKSIPFVRYSA